MAVTRTLLRTNDFGCASCVYDVEKPLKRLPGVFDVEVSYASGRIEIDHDAGTISVKELIESVAKAGYTARPSDF